MLTSDMCVCRHTDTNTLRQFNFSLCNTNSTQWDAPSHKCHTWAKEQDWYMDTNTRNIFLFKLSNSVTQWLNHSKNYTYPSKDWCLFPGMTKRINLPSDSRFTTLAKVFTQKLKAKCVLIDDGIVVSSSFVVHAPSTQNELQTSWNATRNFYIWYICSRVDFCI